MAETLLLILADSFIGKLASRAVQEASLAQGVNDDLRDIKEKVALIKAVLLDAEQKQQQDHGLREWLRQIKRAFHNAEDIIDDLECVTLRRRVVNTSGRITGRGAGNEVILNNVVSRCKYLRALQLIESNYGSLPRSIGKLKHLRCLDLRNSEELERLPGSVCKLQNLQSLCLGGCTNLQALPNGIGNLINLRRLAITTKQSNFPNKEIAQLTSIESLSVNSCDNLEALLEGIQLPSLKLLGIYSCPTLKSLPLHAVPNLETLIIKDCNKLKLSVDHIDNQIPRLRLKLLHLDSLSQLVTFPQWLQGCANTLQSFKVGHCDNLEELPKWLSTAICLKTLQIEDCPKLLSLPDDVHCLPNLEYLEMEGYPELCRRYQRGVGQEWPKISHIKQVIIESSEEEN